MMTNTAVAQEFEPRIFRDVMGHYPTGVAVVTGRAPDGELLALVVGTFSSVSLDPPLVSFMPMKTSKTFARMRECDSLCINIVGGEQEAEMLSIARRWENKLDGVDWYMSPSGNPILKNSIAWIDTSIAEIVEAGDHWITLCRVHDMEVTNPVSPLLFFQGGYGSFVGTSLIGRLSHEILPAIHAAHSAGAQLEDLAQTLRGEVAVFAAVSDDEFATVYHSMAPGTSPEHSFATRFPIVPPIGDTYMFDKSPEVQERWMHKLKDPSEEILETHRRRLAIVKENGFLIAHLPEEGSAAYEQMIRATNEYKKARLTPAEERAIRETIGNTTVDYEQRELLDEERYNVGSIVFPVKDPGGEYTMTLRIAQLPQNMPGSVIKEWIAHCKSVVNQIEKN
ncbi:flavin reductase family protein [Corynebacterium sp. YIM 101645]|uniref:Flavin reductase family protein n=1 Tax=Corynebacterium lemuris TaxID=1859292 RepID=A0ABT2G048_9CORY|nr:flavin reductase family protein [Corynebacterium lemuris]MCS5480365.1 flavin reductase family protein [Corynebacterium lemuris]